MMIIYRGLLFGALCRFEVKWLKEPVA